MLDTQNCVGVGISYASVFRPQVHGGVVGFFLLRSIRKFDINPEGQVYL
jgi:hypothetical protein